MPPRMPNHDPFAPRTAIRLPLTPETGPVLEAEINRDIRSIVNEIPPLDPEDPAYDELYDEAYHATRRYVVDATARYAAQTPDAFNQIVDDLRADQQAIDTLDEDDPLRDEMERGMLIQAEALAPVAHEARTADPNMTINAQECQRTVQAIVGRISAAAREHEVKGERALLAGVSELQEYAKLGLGPIVTQSIEQGILAAAAALEKTSGKRSGLQQKSAAADATARRAEAVAGNVTPPAEPSGFRKSLKAAGRAIVVTAAGHSASELTRHKHAERDSDVLDRADKYLKSFEADSHATAAVERRKHGLAQFEEQKLAYAIRNDEIALRAMVELGKILVEPSTGDIVTEHKYASVDGAPLRQIIDDLTKAPAATTVRGVGDVDPVDNARRTAEHQARIEHTAMLAEIASPDSLPLQFARIDRLYREIEGLDDTIDRLSAHSHSEQQRLGHRLLYSQLMRQRQAMHGLYNQAIAHYGQHAINNAPNTAEGRDLGGRLPMHIIEDGGVLIGDDEYRAIHWQNGDYAALADDDYKGPGVFEAVVHLRNGTAESHGRFVRFAPDGHIRGEWRENRPSVNQLQQLNRQRQHVRQLYNQSGPGGYSYREASYLNEEAREDSQFANMELPTTAERFIDGIDPMTGILLQGAQAIARNSELSTFLNFAQIRANVEAQRNARASAPAATPEAAAARTTEVAAFDTQLARMDQQHFDYGNSHRALIVQAHDMARDLNDHRFLTLRAAAYNGRVTLLGDGTVVLPQEQPRDLRGAPSLHELLGLPDGTWRFGPDGGALQVFTSRGKSPIRRVYSPDESYVRAA